MYMWIAGKHKIASDIDNDDHDGVDINRKTTKSRFFIRHSFFLANALQVDPFLCSSSTTTFSIISLFFLFIPFSLFYSSSRFKNSIGYLEATEKM